MRFLTSRHRWLVPACFIVALGAALLVAGDGLSGSAGASGDAVDPVAGNHYHAADLDGAGRFTGAGEVWPPRPDGAGAPWLVPEAGAATPDSSSPIAQVAIGDSGVAAALGASYNVLEVNDALIDGKGNPQAGVAEVVMYSLTNNQTVTAMVVGDTVTSLTTSAPQDFQPALGPGEIDQAVAIARAWWQDQGAADIDSLTGFGIRAFTADETFFPTRMVYVSFHVDEDTNPVYVSNVDIVNGVVSEARVDS